MESNSLLNLHLNSLPINRCSFCRYTWLLPLVTLLTTSFLQYSAIAQSATQSALSFSGLGYLDYNYVLASPDSGAAGDNGFSYRRIYFTTDYKLSDTFSGRLRFEVSNSSTTAQGRPAPFVKDMYLKWNNIWGEDHNLTIGVTSPPSFTVSEKIWGYRSLERTLLDRNRIVSSRDFGVVAKGPLLSDGSLKYAVMFANNESVRQENDKNKRVYGQLEWYPSDPVSITIGFDYAKLSGATTSGFNIPVFIGYKTDQFSAGIEAFTYSQQLDGAGTDPKQTGLSIFGVLPVNEQTSLIARFDYVEMDLGITSYSDTYTLMGIAFRAHDNVQFIPNLEIANDQRDDEPAVNARITLHVDFK